MRRVSVLLPLLTLTLAACAAEEAPPPAHPVAVAPVSTVQTPSAPPPAPREDGRLPALAAAMHYELTLDVDPDQPRFTGSVRILVGIPAETSYVVLNGRDLHVTHADAQLADSYVAATATVRAAAGAKNPDELVLTFDRPLPAGTAVLDLTFDAPFGDSLAGLYRVKDGDRWYAFTQFEALDARRAFPCFDEPSQKVPFDVRITTPKGLLAVSNMPETARTDVPGAMGKGDRTTFAFATTPPLPSYLVAFAVGDFDVKEGEASPLPIRLITTKGKSGLGAGALADTAALVKQGGKAFGVAYPYPKLDIVAVPNFAAGAMENPGLITYREELLLLDPAHAPARAKISSADVIAHELGHQWFGDLVTTAWWNDIWLNEGFATWAQAKLVEQYRPGYHAALEGVASASDVMDTDSLRTARAVRQPVKTTSEALEAFDGITYRKGAATLTMLEHALGAEVFRAGVESYLREHAWRTATADDLFRALGVASGKDVAKLASPFLDHTGVPSVTIAVECKPKGATLTLSQTPWHRLGDAGGGANAGTLWPIPMDLSVGGEAHRLLLEQATATVTLAKCPAWVDPNVGGYGYYRYAMDAKGWAGLSKVIAKQPEASRVLFVNNLWAQVRAGGLEPKALLEALPALDGETSRVVVEAELAALEGFAHDVTSDAARPAFAKYVAARLAPHRKPKATGVKAAETDLDRALLERSLFRTAGMVANDPATLEEANRLTVAWLKDPASVDGDLARVAVLLGSRKAGRDRIDALRAAMKGARTPNDRKTAMLGLAGFEDKALLGEALSVTLTDEVGTQDVAIVLLNAAYNPATHAAATDWIVSHWDAIRGRLAGFLAGRIFGLPGQSCTKDEIDRLDAFFTPKTDEVEGSKRPLAEALESASLCRALREKDGPAVDRFFHVRAAPVAKAPKP